jgi:hypothetical protein
VSGVFVIGIVVVIVGLIIIIGLVIATAHTDITPDAYTAALFSDHTAKIGALSQARKLLGTKHHEVVGLNLHAKVERATGGIRET